MPCYQNALYSAHKGANQPARYYLLWACLFLFPQWLLADNPEKADHAFHIKAAHSYKLDKSWYIDTQIHYTFSPEALEALANGVALSIEVESRVLLEQEWWWNETIANKTQRYEIQYYALAGQYIIRDHSNKKEFNYPDKKSAFKALGIIQKMFIVHDVLIQDGQHYIVQLQASLDIESLPYLLRPLAYISSDWQLESAWHSWQLK